jgi:hypothetical protein
VRGENHGAGARLNRDVLVIGDEPDPGAGELPGAAMAEARHSVLSDRQQIGGSPVSTRASPWSQHRLDDPAWIGWTFNDFGWLGDNRTL